MARRPRIGITTRLELETRRFYLGRDYSEAVEAAGGVPIQLPLIPKPDYVAEALADLDGILLPGSNTDVDPHLYGEEPHPALGTVVPEKDETDRLVLAEAERLGLPLLAICYGMQALNVWRGGTLVQDIGSMVENALKHEQNVPQDRPAHSLRIEPGSFIGSLEAVRSSNGALRVNSSHHQAVKELGRDLQAAAWAADGVIECIEDTQNGRFVVGVQWHPELTSANDRLSRELFEAFIGKCGMGQQPL